MKIFLDFDDTLFYTQKFIQDEKNIFKKNSISEELFQKHYYQYGKDNKGKKTRRYSLKKQLQGIGKELGMNTRKIEKELKIFLQDTSGYIFGDVALFLNNFSKKELYLVSYSKTEFQKLKIKNSGIVERFKKINITNGKKSVEILKNIKNKKEEMYFIDDRADYIAEVKKKIPQIKTLLIKRKEGRYKNEENKYRDFKVKNLKEALRIINKKINLCAE